MHIAKVTVYAVKAGRPYMPTGATAPETPLPGSEYFRLGGYPQLYSRRSQAALIRVETDDGVVGWGESQAPIGTEVILTLVAEVLGPAVVGLDPEATAVRYHDLCETLRVRGQLGGYQLDAIAGIDTALWDIRGKILGRSIADLLGGRRQNLLPCYVTGLRSTTADGRAEEAAQWTSQGVGVKTSLGLGVQTDIAEIERLRDAVGDGRLYVDALWKYSLGDAVRLGRALDRCGVEFFEAPLAPEDVQGHARLADKIDLPVAVGEALRHSTAFRPWFEAGAVGVAQPDLMRNGVTMIADIARLAEVFAVPVALHVGCTTVVGMAATWQVAATLPNFLIQEFQPVMLDLFNPWLDRRLRLEDGRLVVPTGHGLGITLGEERIIAESTASVTVKL